MSDDALLSTAEVCRLLGNVSTMFVRRRLRDDPTFPRPIQYAKKGPRFWRRAELERWIEAHRLPPWPRPDPDSVDVDVETALNADV